MCQPSEVVEDKLLDQLPPSAQIPHKIALIDARIAEIDAFMNRRRDMIAELQRGAEEIEVLQKKARE